MKRKYIDKFRRLYRFYPLFFWYKCDKCEHEFRRERGWKAVDSNPTAGVFYVPEGVLRNSSYYLCECCAPTREIANEYFCSGKHIQDDHTFVSRDTIKKMANAGPRPKPTPVPPKSVKRAEGEQPQK